MVRFTASEYTQRSLATGKRAFKFFSRIHPIRWLNEHGDDWWYDLKKWLFAVVLIMLGTDPAGAQMMCGTHEEITTKLETQYDEKLVANGISRQGLLVEIYISQDGTFTIIQTIPQGPTCLSHVGDAWEFIIPKRRGI